MQIDHEPVSKPDVSSVAGHPGAEIDTVHLQSAPAPTGAGSSRTHLLFLDGIRGLSALYVVLFHCVSRGGLGARTTLFTGWLDYGRFAVDIFIVLSGYCLMLPVARSASGELRDGVKMYLQRRARRILPPYFASILFAALLVILGRYLHRGSFAASSSDPLALTPGNLITHLLLIHNLFRKYVVSLNPVLWTVALEWQLYFLFPLLLLPVWRRTGPVVTVAVGCAAGVSPVFLLPGYNLGWTCPWFLGLFAMGMAGAALTESRQEDARRRVAQTPWIWLGLPCLLTPVLLRLIPSAASNLWRVNISWWMNDFLIGAAATALILHCVRSLRSGEAGANDPLLRLFQSRPVVGIGLFSYSLYLVHDPFNWITKAAIRGLHLSPIAQFAASIVINVPLAVFAAWVFYRLFERPYTVSKAA